MSIILNKEVYFRSTTLAMVRYTPKGKTPQVYTVTRYNDNSIHIYNKDGNVVFATESVDRTRILSLISIARAEHKGHKFSVIKHDNGINYIACKELNVVVGRKGMLNSASGIATKVLRHV